MDSEMRHTPERTRDDRTDDHGGLTDDQVTDRDGVTQDGRATEYDRGADEYDRASERDQAGGYDRATQAGQVGERDRADEELASRETTGGAELAGADLDGQRAERDTGGTAAMTGAQAGPVGEQPAGTVGGQTTPRHATGSDGDLPTELFEPADIDRFREDWRQIQTRFVDDPREAVEGADRLVADVMRSLTDRFADRKHELEGRWQQGAQAETEDLRQALRSYRSFFDRLLNV